MKNPKKLKPFKAWAIKWHNGHYEVFPECTLSELEEAIMGTHYFSCKIVEVKFREVKPCRRRRNQLIERGKKS